MKLPDKHTYGPVPDAFKASLRLALRTEAAATPVRFSRKRTVLLVALLLIALAATHRAGLLAFVDKWSSQGGNVPALTPLAAENDTPLLQALFDDLVVTVTEAAGDGSECYFATTIALRPGVKGRLVDRDTILNDGTDAPVVTPDGVPVYYVQHVMMAGESYANTTDSIVNEDGSLSIMNAATLLADADTAQMTCIVRYVKAASGAMPDAAGASQKALPFDLPLPPSGEVRSLAAPVALDALGMQIEGLSMRNTPEGYRCFVYFTYQGGAPVAYRLPSNTGDGVQFRLLDESGAVLAEQMGFDWRGGTRFVATRALSADALPDALVRN